MRKKSPCNGCIYWHAVSGPESLHYCGYILVHRHRRPCAPGKDCTAREPRRRPG